ncbi:hydratase [Secundilactobacillus collinoides]|uniref:aconitate hydratase n=1 Tax=Secundilactobacillus collinoides TaxID=33960 RepID=A0A166GG87_SECCO|nr:hydratase [Secundilactobacillus collinoides]KZL38923.1 aconitase [Secundilactobacillus collinoides]
MLLHEKGQFYQDDELVEATNVNPKKIEAGRAKTMAYKIIKEHNTSHSMTDLRLKFDAIASHDITYVSIIQTAKASGIDHFPIPYVLTNCHNSLCAVGGTINADDHRFGLSAAKKYGGIFVPPHVAVIHQYMREMMAGGGKMILGSDSHTRYGALGTMAIGEGGGELVKQLMGKTYDVAYPEVVAIHLTGKPRPGIGPQDVALALVGAVFNKRFVKNRILEFIGPGIRQLDQDFRNGIDVMTTETTCLSSIWETDDTVKDWLTIHGRADDYKKLTPEDGAYYDRSIDIDLSKIESMIALPFHPSNAFSIHELNANLDDILGEVEANGEKQLDGNGLHLQLRDKVHNGRLYAQDASIAGCAGGTFGNIRAASHILDGHAIGSKDFALTIYPSSMPIYQRLVDTGEASTMMTAGAIFKTAFCGPCFGGGETPANNALSIRHTTRNFIHREGSKPQEGQLSSVALMDARSIAASALNGGAITAATDIDFNEPHTPVYSFNPKIYNNLIFHGEGKADHDQPLLFGPNIKNWPKFTEMPDSLLVKVAAYLTDPVTTTDELIPSGDTSSYRSNPEKLASFALSRKVPEYVERAKLMRSAETQRRDGGAQTQVDPDLTRVYDGFQKKFSDVQPNDVMLGTMIYAHRPGDGSAREQAASCQKVLGGMVNVAREYATKRYRSNLINWGILPLLNQDFKAAPDDFLYLTGIHDFLANAGTQLTGYLFHEGKWKDYTFEIGALTDDERKILLSGCLINLDCKEMLAKIHG